MVERNYGEDLSPRAAMEKEKLEKILNTVQSQSVDQLSIKETLLRPMEAYNRYKMSLKYSPMSVSTYESGYPKVLLDYLVTRLFYLSGIISL